MATQAGVLRIANVSVDVKVREYHNLGGKLTTYGVEDGQSITDHAILNPNTVDITFEMTNAAGDQRAKKSFQDFLNLVNKREPMQLVTEHATYNNMVIVGFTPDHSAPFRGAYKATLRLQEAGITGRTSSVTSTWGGRDEEALKKPNISNNSTVTRLADGTPVVRRKEPTYRTAVAPRNAGTVSTQNNGAVLRKCEEKLKQYARGIF